MGCKCCKSTYHDQQHRRIWHDGLSIVGRNNKPVDGIQPTCSMNGILSTPDCINHGSLVRGYSPKSHNLILKWHPPNETFLLIQGWHYVPMLRFTIAYKPPKPSSMYCIPSMEHPANRIRMAPWWPMPSVGNSKDHTRRGSGVAHSVQAKSKDDEWWESGRSKVTAVAAQFLGNDSKWAKGLLCCGHKRMGKMGKMRKMRKMEKMGKMGKMGNRYLWIVWYWDLDLSKSWGLVFPWVNPREWRNLPIQGVYFELRPVFEDEESTTSTTGKTTDTTTTTPKPYVRRRRDWKPDPKDVPLLVVKWCELYVFSRRICNIKVRHLGLHLIFIAAKMWHKKPQTLGLEGSVCMGGSIWCFCSCTTDTFCTALLMLLMLLKYSR